VAPPSNVAITTSDTPLSIVPVVTQTVTDGQLMWNSVGEFGPRSVSGEVRVSRMRVGFVIGT